MIEDLNNHIDFMGLFKYLVETHRDELEVHKYEAEHFKMILDFANHHIDDGFEVLSEECELTDSQIIFIFGIDLEEPNESTNYVATANYDIVFDRIMDEFVSCEYEQG